MQMKKNKLYILRWLPVMLWMGFIFYMSAQPAQQSSEWSSTVMNWLMRFVESWLLVDESVFHLIVRKGAHIGAYFILAIWTMFALEGKRLKALWIQTGIALVICVLYAISDEVHQLFVPGRSGEVADVGIDTVGALLGVIFYIICRFCFYRLQRR